jgi:hypothetical protein
MKKGIHIVVLLLMVFSASSGYSGDIANFKPGEETSGPRVLEHVELKSLIAEFADPLNTKTGLGKSLGFLVWGEVLAAISDQAGAGVIIAHAPGDETVGNLLEKDYHDAAIKIARYQEAPMLLWGMVSEINGSVIIDTAFTLLPEVGDALLKVKIVPASAGGGNLRDDEILQALIPRSRFSFAWEETTRKELFQRPIVTMGTAVLRSKPSKEAREVTRVQLNTGLQAEDMEKGWYRIRRSDGSIAFVSAAKIRVPPREVQADRTNVNLRARPDKHAPAVKEGVRLKGTYQVLDARYLASGIWYRLKVGDSEGWIAGWLVQPRFSLPAVHFMAGLYRYMAKRYSDAEQEFSQFLSLAGPDTRNTVRATALQLLAASRMLKSGAIWHGGRDEIIEPLAQAQRLTPYDPASYNLQALAYLGAEESRALAFDALDKALALDNSDLIANSLLRTLKRIATTQTIYRYTIRLNEEDVKKIKELSER